MPAIGEMGSAMRTRVRSQEFTASETGSVDSDESGSSGGGSEGFELKEDLSFWKDHNVQIREDAKKGMHVENLKEFEVSSARDVMLQHIQCADDAVGSTTRRSRTSAENGNEETNEEEDCN